MARDYAPKSQPAKASSTTPKKPAKAAPTRKPAVNKRPAPARAQQGGLSVRWILSLAAVGGFIGFITYLNSLPQVEPQKQAVQPPSQAGKSPEAENATDRKPGFRFYEMLPDSEVVPPEVEEYTPGPASQDFDYLVQTGSFRTQTDAERQRAQIAFQGLRASVKRIDMDSGSTWYRVNVGPFTTRSQMNSAIDKLVSINIQPLVRKIPKKEG